MATNDAMEIKIASAFVVLTSRDDRGVVDLEGVAVSLLLFEVGWSAGFCFLFFASANLFESNFIIIVEKGGRLLEKYEENDEVKVAENRN